MFTHARFLVLLQVIIKLIIEHEQLESYYLPYMLMSHQGAMQSGLVSIHMYIFYSRFKKYRNKG